jgi:hypothetical protein
MPPCFDNALALVLYLALKRSLQMVANHSARNGMKEPCINNNNRVEIYFHNDKFLCDIFAKATEVHITTSPTRFLTHTKIYKKLQIQAFQELWEI